MKILIIAIGNKMPNWINLGISDYTKRFHSISDYSIEIREIPALKRSKTSNIKKIIEVESKSLISAIPKGFYPIALDVRGKSLSSENLAKKIENNHNQGTNLAILIGGPEGFGDLVRDFVHESWSLSALTMPHPIARLVLVETIYRSISILKKHPYHRG